LHIVWSLVRRRVKVWSLVRRKFCQFNKDQYCTRHSFKVKVSAARTDDSPMHGIKRESLFQKSLFSIPRLFYMHRYQIADRLIDLYD